MDLSNSKNFTVQRVNLHVYKFLKNRLGDTGSHEWNIDCDKKSKGIPNVWSNLFKGVKENVLIQAALEMSGDYKVKGEGNCTYVPYSCW